MITNYQKSFFLILSLFLFTCTSIDDKVDKKTEKKVFYRKKIGETNVKYNRRRLFSNSLDMYNLECNYDSTYSFSVKKKINIEGHQSTEEWIKFDSLNRLRSINTLIVNFEINEKDCELMTNHLTNISFDQDILLINSDTNLLFLSEVDNVNEFKFQKQDLTDHKLNLELISLLKIPEDSTFATYSIHKSYLLKNQKFVEKKVSLTNRDYDFKDVKWSYMKRYHLDWYIETD